MVRVQGCKRQVWALADSDQERLREAHGTKREVKHLSLGQGPGGPSISVEELMD